MGRVFALNLIYIPYLCIPICFFSADLFRFTNNKRKSNNSNLGYMLKLGTNYLTLFLSKSKEFMITGRWPIPEVIHTDQSRRTSSSNQRSPPGQSSAWESPSTSENHSSWNWSQYYLWPPPPLIHECFEFQKPLEVRDGSVYVAEEADSFLKHCVIIEKQEAKVYVNNWHCLPRAYDIVCIKVYLFVLCAWFMISWEFTLNNCVVTPERACLYTIRFSRMSSSEYNIGKISMVCTEYFQKIWFQCNILHVLIIIS